MMFKASTLKNYAIEATDGAIGTVSDLLFDDRSFRVRWLVVDTGTFLPGRKVLIHPTAIAQAVHDQDQLLMTLTRAQIAASPDLAADAPVSMQMEAHLNDYYGWDPYWGSMAFGSNAIASGISPPPLAGADLPPENEVLDSPRNEGDPHLRSLDAVLGYRVEATDGEIGHLTDFQADDRSWEFRYLVVDTRKWWIGAHDYVLLSPASVRAFDWSEHTVTVDRTQEQLRSGPPADAV